MNEKLYQYWFFLWRGDINPDSQTKSFLYAYTDRKDYAKRFKEFRTAKNMICYKKKLTKEELNELADISPNLILKEIKLRTIKGNKTIEIPLVMTVAENNTIINLSTKLVCSDIYTACWDSPYIFKKEIIKALKTLGYLKFHSVISSSGEFIDDGDEDYDVDELSIFIKNFGFTINNENED